MVSKATLTLILIFTGGLVGAAESADILKACLENKKPKTYCACLERNVDKRVKAQELSDDQLKDLIALAGGPKPATDDEKNTSSEAMADYFAGLEFHCQENPKYSAP